MEHFLRASAATAVAAAETLRRHTLRLLLRQQGRCGVHSQTAVAAAGTLRRHIRTLLLRQATTLRRHSGKLLLRQQGTLPVVVTSHQLLRRSQRRACDEAPQIRGEVPDIASVVRGRQVVFAEPWWSANPAFCSGGGGCCDV